MENTQPTENEQTSESTQRKENKQYLNYKDKFKKIGIINIVSSVCALLAILLFFFVKSFQIKSDSVVLMSFSLVDEFRRAIKNAFSGGIFAFLELFSVFGFIFILVGAVAAIVNLIRNILNIVSLEKYSLIQYDNIKRRIEEKSKKKDWGQYWFASMFYGGVIFEAFSIMYSKLFRGVNNYFAYINGVSWNIAFFVIFAITFTVLHIIARKILKDIKYEIMKEEYGA